MEILVSVLCFVTIIFQISYILGVLSIFNFFQRSFYEGSLQAYYDTLANTNFLSTYVNYVKYITSTKYSLIARITSINSFSAILRSAIIIGVCLPITLFITFSTGSDISSWTYIFALFVLSVISALFTVKELFLANALKQDFMVPFHTYKNMAAPLVSTLNYSLFMHIDYEKADEEVFIRENRELLKAYNDIYCSEDDVKSMVVIRKTIFEDHLSVSTIIDSTFVTIYIEKTDKLGFDFVASKLQDVTSPNTNFFSSEDILKTFDAEYRKFYVSKVNDTVSHYDYMYEEIIESIVQYNGEESSPFIILAPTKDFNEFFEDI